MEYDKNYYNKFTSKDNLYNCNRPIIKTTRALYQTNPPFQYMSLISIGFGNVGYLDMFNKKFGEVTGVEINPESIEQAKGKYSVHLINLAAPDIDCSLLSDIVACHYLFEHLADNDISILIKNMTKIAPINNITLTDKDSPNYIEDPTHKNPKTLKQWKDFMREIYKSQGFVLVKNQSNSFTFMEENMYKRAKNLVKEIQTIYDHKYLTEVMCKDITAENTLVERKEKKNENMGTTIVKEAVPDVSRWL